MSLRNLIKEWIHSDKVKEYEEFVRNHEKAINSYLFDGYRPRYIILQEDLDLFSEYDKQVDIIRKEFPNTILDHFTFEQKELLLSRKETILELYRVYLKSKVIFDNTNNIFRKFPHAYNIICKEIAGKKLRSVDMPKSRNMNNIPTINSIYDLSPEQKAQILDRITEFPDLEEDCIEALKREQIHEKFENEILSDYNRRRFYKSFITKYAPGVNDEEEYCVYHIPQLDKYAKQQFYSFRFISQIVCDKRRSKYYKDFLKLHSIKESDQEEYCVNHIKDLDNYIKQQLQDRERLFNEWEKEQEEEFAKNVLSDKDRATHYIGFCESNNIPSDEQKEYVLNNLSLLDSYVSDFKKKEARQLRQETIDANWEERCSNYFRSFSLFNYYPTTCEWEANDDEWRVRRLTWNFKYSYGKNIMSIDHTIALNEIIPLVEKVLIGTFGDDLPKLTLACIPASTKLDTARRYEEFSIRLCRETKMINGYYYIQVTQDGTAKHTNGMNSEPAKIEIDKDFFKKKYVLIFDDVITRGRSMLSFRQKLVEAGAFVIGGMSVGRTMHVRLGNHPIDSFEKESNNYVEVPPF